MKREKREEGGGDGGGGAGRLGGGVQSHCYNRMIEERLRLRRKRKREGRRGGKIERLYSQGVLMHIPFFFFLLRNFSFLSGAGESDSLYQMETNGRFWSRSKVWLRLR